MLHKENWRGQAGISNDSLAIYSIFYFISVLDSPISKTNIIVTLEISQKNKQDASKTWVASCVEKACGPRHCPKTKGLVKTFQLGSFGKEMEDITDNKIYM